VYPLLLIPLKFYYPPAEMAASRYPQLAWEQTSLGHFEREIDEAECFYTCLATSYEGSGRMFFAITGFVSFSVHVDDDISSQDIGRKVDEALRHAWLRLRYDHPTIASQTFYDDHKKKWKKRYTPFHPNDVFSQTEAWLQETFVAISPGMSGPEWCNADPPAPKLPTLFIITSPSSTGKHTEGVIRRDVIIRSPHDIMDGIGTLHLLNNLLAHAAQLLEERSWSLPTYGSEIQSLSPPLRVAASIAPILALDQQERLQDLVTGNESLRKEMDLLVVPFNRGEVLPGKHQRTVLELSSSDTGRLRKACRRVGATVTHVYHAAIAITIRDMQTLGPHRRTARYINYSLINERPKCSGEYATSKHAAAVYHSVSGNSLALDLTIPSIAKKEVQDRRRKEWEFLTLVDQVKTYYHNIHDSLNNLALVPSFWSMATPHISEPTATNPSVPAPNPSPSVSISSMGVIDKIISSQHGPFKLNNPWVTGEELGTGLGLFLGTWEGSLELSAAYNDAWHDRKEVDGFLRHCHDVVWKGLRLDESTEADN
jgi:hypothetical protein